MTVKKIVPNLIPGTYAFKLRAIDPSRRTESAWSSWFNYTVVGDANPPPTPSKPTVLAIFGGAAVTWVDSGYAIPNDFARVDVYFSENGGPYQKFDSIFAIGASVSFTKAVLGKKYRFKFVAIDTSGNGSGFSEASDEVESLSIDIDSTPPEDVDPATIITSWSGTDLIILFNKKAGADTTSYIIELTAGGITIPFSQDIQPATQQKFVLTQKMAQDSFGDLYASYTGLIKSLDKLNNPSAGTPFITTGFVDNINGTTVDTSTWSVIPADTSYIVSWSHSYGSNYKETKVYESTDNGITYDLVGAGQSPIVIVVGDLNTRKVKIQHLGQFAGSQTNLAGSAHKEVASYEPIPDVSLPADNNFSVNAPVVEADPNGLFEFDKKVLVSWTENSDTITAGYRIRFRKWGSSDPYTYFSVPGKSKTSTYIYGLKAGQEYEVGVTTYTVYGTNNETEWQTLAKVTSPATTDLSTDKAITAGDMKLGYGIGGDNSQKGLYVAPDNYWYVQGNTNSSTAARLSVGGSTDKMLWDGTNLSITGTINANAGSFKNIVNVGTSSDNAQLNVYTPVGSIKIGRLYNGVYPSGTWADDVGIFGRDGSGEFFRLDTSAGVVTKKGTIGGWTIQEDALYKPLAGLYAPSNPASTDIAFWAGASLANRASAKFRVNYDGDIYSGKITIAGGSLNINNTFKVSESGFLEATGAKINGELTVTSPSEIQSNLLITGGGELKVSQDANNYIKIGSTGLVGVNSGIVKTQLTTSGVLTAKLGTIGGWTISDTSISTGVVQFNSSGSGNIISVVKGGVTTFAVNQAGDVQIRGQVTILDAGGNENDFLTEADVGASGATVINGARIQTGTLNADRISGGNITATIGIQSPNITFSGNSYNYWYSSGAMSIGNNTAGSIFSFDPTAGQITIALQPYDSNNNTTSRLYFSGLRGNYDGTANDPTVVAVRSTGQVTLGRTLYWGGNKGNPNNLTSFDVTNLDYAVGGDLYFTTSNN